MASAIALSDKWRARVLDTRVTHVSAGLTSGAWIVATLAHVVLVSKVALWTLNEALRFIEVKGLSTRHLHAASTLSLTLCACLTWELTSNGEVKVKRTVDIVALWRECDDPELPRDDILGDRPAWIDNIVELEAKLSVLLIVLVGEGIRDAHGVGVFL